MEKILIECVIPIIVIMALGYVFGKRKFFDNDQRQGLNKFVLNVALPAALFISIVKASREMLASDISLTVISIVGVVGLFMLSFVLCRVLFKHNIQEAAICALITGSPTIGFLGFAVLDPIYGNTVDTNLVIGIVSIVVNAITIPIGMFLINVGQAKSYGQAGLLQSGGKDTGAAKTSGAAEPLKIAKTHDDEITNPGAEVLAASADKQSLGKRHGNKNLDAFLDAMKHPVCWAPLLAIILVLIGVRIPDEVDPTFDLIAKANSGVAVLAAGLSLSTVKFSLGAETIWNTCYRLLITPAIILIIGIMFGMGTDASKLGMLVMSVALPPAFSGVIMSSRFNIYVKEGMSTTAVATVAFAATSVLWAWLVPIAAHAL